mmetsp:Transcript_24272/g.57486  ORF Transcript_24272/g.57486 Transcript_24272/m.57486 type:complete len:209 (+) Transcript_24272:670-1296(+)
MVADDGAGNSACAVWALEFLSCSGSSGFVVSSGSGSGWPTSSSASAASGPGDGFGSSSGSSPPRTEAFNATPWFAVPTNPTQRDSSSATLWPVDPFASERWILTVGSKRRGFVSLWSLWCVSDPAWIRLILQLADCNEKPNSLWSNSSMVLRSTVRLLMNEVAMLWIWALPLRINFEQEGRDRSDDRNLGRPVVTERPLELVICRSMP